MRIEASCQPDLHLTYCLNIHRGECWAENRRAIETYACAVRERVAGDKPFGLGLRLSNTAARELAEPDALSAFRDFLDHRGLYVFTINGFPFGQFHGTPVKADVYAPDWRTDARVDYTLQLAEILGALLPAGVEGSISTVPGTYRAWSRCDRDCDAVLRGLGRAVIGLHEMQQRTGRKVRLALEPEPDCLWDTTGQMIELFNRILPDRGAALLTAEAGNRDFDAERLWNEYLSVCVDTCHQAVMFENVVAGLTALRAAGVPIAKIQISAAPCCDTGAAALAELTPFIDPVYLHQSFLRDALGNVTRFPDLPQALAAASKLVGLGELRTHFHIPLSVASHGHLRSTRAELGAAFFALLRDGIAPHLEVETYTFDVLPEALRQRGVVESVADELRWVLANLAGGTGANGGG